MDKLGAVDDNANSAKPFEPLDHKKVAIPGLRFVFDQEPHQGGCSEVGCRNSAARGKAGSADCHGASDLPRENPRNATPGIEHAGRRCRKQLLLQGRDIGVDLAQ